MATGGAPAPVQMSDLFRLEDKVYHAVDNLALGLVTVVPNNIYVTDAGTDHSIQRGIDAAGDGDTVHIEAGEYVENLTIPKPLHLLGAGEGQTILYPATADVGTNPDAGPAFRGSQMIVVRASGVEIAGLTLDGNNPDPLITSGVTRGGVDIDARNGIIEDYTAGVFNGLSVHDVTVQNVYLRGIYVDSGVHTDNQVNGMDAAGGNSYSAATAVNAGTLRLTGSAQTASVSVSVSPGSARLDLAGAAGSSLAGTTPVFNNGILEVSSTLAQDVLAVSGTGSTQVGANAVLRAGSIVQSTLSIGAGGSVVIRETAADASAVPEPSTWATLLSLLAGGSWAAFRRRR